MSIGKAWGQASEFLVREARLVIALALALLVLPSVLLGLLAPQTLAGEPPEGAIALVWLAVALLGLAGRLAIIRLTVGPAISVGSAIKEGFRRLPSALGALMIFVLPIALILTPILPPIMAAPDNPPPREAALFLLICIAAFVIGTRLLGVSLPVAVAEKVNSFALLKRSWSLTRGHWWRLMGFLLLYFITAAIALRALYFVVGSVAMLISGAVEPLSLSALIVALVMSCASALFVATLAVMIARVYAQLSTPDPGVPEVRREG